MSDTTFALNPGNFKRVKLIPDGVGNFARGMGMICKFENNFAFGERAWRYSAVINDMMIEKLFIEVSALFIYRLNSSYCSAVYSLNHDRRMAKWLIPWPSLS